MKNIQKALGDYIKARDKLISLAKRQYVGQTHDCPLNLGGASHYELAQSLWGLGCYEWTCEFCGSDICQRDLPK